VVSSESHRPGPGAVRGRMCGRIVSHARLHSRRALARTLTGIALALLVACAVALGAPRPASAAPASTINTATIAAKKAQQEANKREMEAMRSRLAARVSEYVKVSRQLQTTRAEVDKLGVQIAEQDAALEEAKAAFELRAVELYRSGNMSMLEILMTANSLQELMSRANFLLMLSQRDANTITDYRKIRSESAYLQDSLSNRMNYLTTLQTQVDDQRSQIESDLAQGESRSAALGTDIARLMRGDTQSFSGGRPSDSFNPDTVISEANFRDSGAMTVGDIQKFLDRQPGVLKSYRTKDHNGNVRFASEMIAEAAVAFRINPKVLLVKLQKEQSLLSRTSPTQTALDWATGCGKADSRTFYQYKGFGNQIWWGAQKLDKNSKPWKPGIRMTIDGGAVYPTNAATYSLYKYTPHIRGTTSFWMLYWRYFGDPLV